MDLEPVPIEHSCLGCKRYFLLHEVLPLETITVEFKNYPIPIKEKFFKAILLKTIVAFMNGKGGSIFIGVDDATGQVLGMTLGRKEMDEFRLVVKQMLEKVVPAVDLVKEEQVCVEFIPVLQGKERYFYGKYVIKFIVRQGDTSKLYCISEKIQVDRKQIEIISAFRRHNLGGIEELKGIKVIQEIYEKARNPYKPFETFHKNCNPHPISPALVERPKAQKFSKIFADSDSSESSARASSSKKMSFSQASDNSTIIDRIQDLDTTVKDQQKNHKEKPALKENQNPFKTAEQAGCVVYFQNVRDVSIPKLINYLKNSTPAKFALQIYDENGVICVKMKNRQERDGLIQNLIREPYKRLINQFGSNGKVHLLKSLSHKSSRVQPQIRQKSPTPATKTQFKPSTYRLLFCNYVKNLETSVENYLKNSININIKRKMQKTKDGIELLFESRRDMAMVYDLCLNPPHNRLLGQFWTKGAIKIQKFERVIGEKLSSGKEERTPEKRVKLQNDPKDLPDLMNLMDKIDQQHKPRKNIQIQSLQLIASSLQPSQVSKLSNYMVNNMFYNIQKKLFASKDRYYIRIVFNNTEDCKEFMRYCMLEQHKHMLAQFSGSKSFRIGVPGQSLIISPYSDTIKEELKKLVVRVLGMSAVKKSSVKEYSGVKVWALTMIDPSKVLECYEKLEAFFRKQGFFMNNEWYRFKVFLDYLSLSE